MSVLAIVEVSQKQAYIFSDNKLHANVLHSAEIAYVTSPAFFKQAAETYYTDENLVYSGGGHTVLEFPDLGRARCFTRAVTKAAKQQYPDMELFASLLELNEDPKADDIQHLIEKLEIKKSMRTASFRHGSFGIEQVDVNTGKPVRADQRAEKMPEEEDRIDRKLTPTGFARAYSFENLGGSRDEKNFIAVVHIDGNSMGARVEAIRDAYGDRPWKEYKQILRDFSEGIDCDFKTAYLEMCQTIDEAYREGTLADLDIACDKDGQPYFPIRRIISAGDDICFVTEGRIGIECARIFLEKLYTHQNKIDGKPYAACAGVAIVHQKYPFFKAYDLAEQLCSHAKNYIATTAGKDAAGHNCVIDWHIEYGEVPDSVSDLREQYIAEDGTDMVLRPYIVLGDLKNADKDYPRAYGSFLERMADFSFARGKYKGLRTAIRQGKQAVDVYLKSQLMTSIALTSETQISHMEEGLAPTITKTGSVAYVEAKDKKLHSTLFDVIEAMDVFLPIEEKEVRT